jgi:hypothetical protein
MFSVDIEVSVLNCGLLISGNVFFMLLTDFFLKQFKLGGIKSAVGNKISEELGCFVHIILEHLQLKGTDFSASDV